MLSAYPAASEHLNISPFPLTFHLGGEALHHPQLRLYQGN